jgi:hypothetical protein
MTHQPIHMALFIWIILLSALLLYTHVIVTTLYIYLKDAWLQSLMGGPWDDSQPGIDFTKLHFGRKLFGQIFPPHFLDSFHTKTKYTKFM